MRINQSDDRLLIKAGCFDSVEGKQRRPALLWELLAKELSSKGTQTELFTMEKPALPSPPPYDDRTVLNHELETLGMLVSTHPLTFHRQAIDKLRPVKTCEMIDWCGRYVTMIGWWVTGKTVQDKNGHSMEFVSFEDTNGIFDATFFPKAYERFCQKMSRHRPHLLEGKVEEEFVVRRLD